MSDTAKEQLHKTQLHNLKIEHASIKQRLSKLSQEIDMLSARLAVAQEEKVLLNSRMIRLDIKMSSFR